MAITTVKKTNPASPKICFTRTANERQDWVRFWDGLRWTKGFLTSEEAKAYREHSGGVVRGRFVETRPVVSWRVIR